MKNGSFFGVPRGVWKRAEAINFDADSPPGAKNSSFLRAPGSRRPVGAIFRRFLSIVGFFAKWKIVPKYYACQQKQGFGTSRCESSRSRVATLKNFENRPEKPPEILENRVSGAPGRPSRSTFAARGGSINRRAARRATRRDQVCPIWSVGACRVAPGLPVPICPRSVV